MRSTPLVADGKIYSVHEQRPVVHPASRPSDGVEDRPPAAADRRRERRLADRLARPDLPADVAGTCIASALPDQKPPADPLPPQPKEDPVTDKTPASRAGRSVRRAAQAGRASRRITCGCSTRAASTLRDASRERSANSRSMARARSRRTARTRRPPTQAIECALVTCKVGDLTGTARVRIVPPLPWKFDFNNDAERAAHLDRRPRALRSPRRRTATSIIAKKTVLPTPTDPNNKLGTRSFVWMGPTDLANYTIQADVLLTEGERPRCPTSA